MKTGRPTVPPDYVSENFENVKSKKKSIYSLIFMSISNIIENAENHFGIFFRVYLDFTNR
jgi:hypothetical protein